MNFCGKRIHGAVALALAGMVAASDACAVERMLTLRATGISVTLGLSDPLAAQTKGLRHDTLFRFALIYPGGQPASADRGPDGNTIYVLLRPVGKNMKTRTEGKVSEATATPPVTTSERPWLHSKSPDGVLLYKYKFASGGQEDLRVWRASNGSLVGAQIAMGQGSFMHQVDRRYKDVLEVIYLYSRTIMGGPESMDDFVVDFLNRHVQVQGVSRP